MTKRTAGRSSLVAALVIAVTTMGDWQTDAGPPNAVRVEHPITLVGPAADWRCQDYVDSRGIVEVRYDPVQRWLVLACRMKAGDPNAASGEVVLDLKYVPTLEGQVPIDMTQRTIRVDVMIPAGFAGPHFAPNGCQLLAKDDQFKSQYSVWQNCFGSGVVTMVFTPSANSEGAGHTDAGFNPKRIRTIGIKFGMNSQGAGRFTGEIRVRGIAVNPPLPFGQPPALPQGDPVPHVKSNSVVVAKPDGFFVGGRKTFIVGGNLRLIEYGQNFGTTAWFPWGNGASKHPGFVAAKLQTYRKAGITLVRVGLLDDGRTVLDKESQVVGFNETFRSDVSSFLDLAAQENVRVEFVLVDFLLAGKEENVDGVWVRGRRKLIEDPKTRAQFLTSFLDPFLKQFGNHPAVWGIDVVNEPEWIVAAADGGGWEEVEENDPTKAPTPVSLQSLREFIAECAKRVRAHTRGKLVTVGVSCKYVDLLEGLDLDYMAAHYYPWMGDLKANLARLPKNKPWMLEEFPGKENVTSYLTTVLNAGGAGALLWNLTPEIDEQSYRFAQEEAKLQEIRRFVDATDREPPRQLGQSASASPPEGLNSDRAVAAQAGSVVGGVYHCTRTDCPGHSSPADQCAYYCDKAGCPGHALSSHHCAYYCAKAGCPGHSSPSHSCAYYCGRPGCPGHSAASHRCE